TWNLAGQDMERATTSDESLTIVVEDSKTTGARRAHIASVAAAVIRADRWDFRSFGTTLSFAYLATGRIAAYIEAATTGSVHIAAGSLLASEAGGSLSDLDGNPWEWGAPSLLAAATPELHNELLNLANS